MKKLIAAALALVLCLGMMAGCGKTEEQKPDGMPNPVTTYKDMQEQANAIGFGLASPAGAEDVVYQSINSMAETVFTLDGVTYSYRAEATDKIEAYDISGLNYDMEKSAGSVQGRDAAVMLCKDAGAVMWLDAVAGINYNLSCVPAVDADALLKLAGEIFTSVQGDS